MADTTTAPPPPPPPARFSSIKSLAETPHLTSIPPTYVFTQDLNDPVVLKQDGDGGSIPIIDFSLLTSATTHQHSNTIQDLHRACYQWGFFMVVNHRVPESLMKAMIEKCNEFFNLTEEEKSDYEGKHVLDGVRCGTSFNASVEKVFFWRDFLKVFVHPYFHSPVKPSGFSEVLMEYCNETRRVAMALLRAISESLGLDIDKALNLKSGLQILTANLYPPCPQPELAMGMPPHSDHALLTLLIQNQNGGLQLLHEGEWVSVNGIPNAILVNTGDLIEILSNGKYKSVMHRAMVNNKSTRISIATTYGPPLDMVVGPASELVDDKDNPPAYIRMKYGEYLELQQSNQLHGKSCLDRVRV